MRVRLDGYFAHYELSAWPELGGGEDGGRRLQITELDEARNLLRRLLGHDTGATVRPLLLALGEVASIGGRDELVEHLAKLVVRGQLVVERHPIQVMISDDAERYEHELSEQTYRAFNEFEDEVRVIHWLVVSDAPMLVIDSTPEPPPTVVVDSEPDELPVIVLDSTPKPPPVIVLDSTPKLPPVIVLDSTPKLPPRMSYGGDVSD